MNLSHHILITLLLVTNSTLPMVTLPMSKLAVAALDQHPKPPSLDATSASLLLRAEDELEEQTSTPESTLAGAADPLAFWSVPLMRKTFQITCCMDALPTVNERLLHNFTYEFINYVVEEQSAEEVEVSLDFKNFEFLKNPTPSPPLTQL